MKRVKIVLFLLVALGAVVYAADAIVMSTGLSQAQLDAVDWKVLKLNVPAAPATPPPSPWTRQSLWDRNCLLHVKEWASEAKAVAASGFCDQWDNPTGTLSPCPNPSPASAPFALGCSYTAAQKSTMCAKFSRVAGCDLCPGN